MQIYLNSLGRHICLGLSIFISTFFLTIICSSVYMKMATSPTEEDDYEVDSDEFDFTTVFTLMMKIETSMAQRHKESITSIRQIINRANKEQPIFNEKIFGAAGKGNFIVVTQIHGNIAFLNLLISSLKKVMGISSAILIFCHDFYDHDINEIISEIKFMRFMQIYYPFSNQVFPMKFPGNDVEFCSHNFNCTKFCVEAAECVRNHILAQKKHFWWWHMNFVFDRLYIMKDHSQPVVFLEENQFVLEDMIYMLKAITDLMGEHPEWEMISFGADAPASLAQYCVPESKLLVEPWDPSQPSLGFAFNRTLWNNIKKNSKLFCHFGDYRWDVSLSYLSSKRPEGHITVVATVGPRVLPVSLCDGTVAGCSLIDSIEDKHIFASRVHDDLYPHSFDFIDHNKTVGSISAGGDWNDVRDSELCMYFSQMEWS